MNYIDYLNQNYSSGIIDSFLNNTKYDLNKCIYLYVSNKCNLSCKHCYLSEDRNQEQWNIERLKNHLRQLKDYGYNKIKITGGEPFIYPQIKELLYFLFKVEFDEIQIETNGNIINNEIIDEIAKHSNIMISVSLDHLKNSLHDEFRNTKGAFDKSVKFINLLVDRNITTRVTSVLYKGNYKSISQIIDFVHSLKIQEHRLIFNIHPSGNAIFNQGIELSISDCFEAINDIFQSPYFMSNYLILSLPPVFLPPEKLTQFHSCGWGKNVIGLLPNGDLTMCYGSFSKETPIGGNIKDICVENIFSQAYFKDLSQIRNHPAKGICSNCLFYLKCRGMCKFSSYTHYNDFEAPYPFCQQAYNIGLFPLYGIRDMSIDSRFDGMVIRHNNLTSNEYKN